MRSPVKTIIHNVTTNAFTVPLTNRLNLTFSPCGTAFDTATVDGEIFSRIENGAAADRLMTLILDGTLAIRYKFDAMFADIELNRGDALFAGLPDAVAEITKRNGSEFVASTEEKNEEPVVTITGPVAEVIETAEEVVEEPVVESSEVAAPTTETTVETVEEPPAAVIKEEPSEEVPEEVVEAEPVVETKTRKRTKKIKVD